MSKFIKILGFSLLGLLAIFLVCRLTGILNYASIATPSNEPTLKKNSIVFCSNLKKPKKFDFILYKYNSPEFDKGVWIHRLCGLPGDKIQLVNGELFINDISTESLLKTYHNYFISSSDLDNLEKKQPLDEDLKIQTSSDSFMISVNKSTIKKYKLKVRSYLPDDTNGEIFQKYNQHWTADNFGPLVIPDNSYFVLGDNRSNSLDSRYIGLIPKSDYVGTVLGK